MAVRMLSLKWLAFSLAVSVCLAPHQPVRAQTGPSVSKPGVSQPIQPSSVDAPAKTAAPAPTWIEGQPVHVMSDLKTYGPSPKKARRGKSNRHRISDAACDAATP